MQDCSIPIANSLEILQSCTKPSKSDKWWGTWRACLVRPADSLTTTRLGLCNSLGLLQGAVWNHAKLSIPHRLGNLFNSLASGVTKWSPRTCFYALSFMMNLFLGDENIFAFSIISQHRGGSYQWLSTGLQFLHCSCTGDTAVLP